MSLKRYKKHLLLVLDLVEQVYPAFWKKYFQYWQLFDYIVFFVERRGAQEPQSRGEQCVLLDGPGAHRPHLFHVRVFLLFNQINWFS